MLNSCLIVDTIFYIIYLYFKYGLKTKIKTLSKLITKTTLTHNKK